MTHFRIPHPASRIPHSGEGDRIPHPAFGIPERLMGISDFRNLDVWQTAHQAALDVYRLTKSFPPDERYDLVRELRKTARSIPDNIAEGYGRRRPLDKTRFYNIAEGSADELRSQLLLAKDLNYTPGIDEVWQELDRVAAMLHRLIQSIEKSV